MKASQCRLPGLGFSLTQPFVTINPDQTPSGLNRVDELPPLQLDLNLIVYHDCPNLDPKDRDLGLFYIA